MEKEKAELERQLSLARAILWDVDGTLFSAEDILGASYRQAFVDFKKHTKRDIHIPALSEILKEIGKPVKEIFQNLGSGLSQSEQDKLSLSVLSELVRIISFGGGKYYENMPQTLAKLYDRGYLFFSASNGRYPYIETILRMSKTIQYFHGIDTINNESIRDKSELVAYILKKYKLKPEEALLVGDRQSDRDAAYENGVPFIACRYGHGEPSEWKDALLLIDSIADLESYLPLRLLASP